LTPYLSGVEFRQRVEAVVEAFNAMRHHLDQERRAADGNGRAARVRIDAVTLNVQGMYGICRESCQRSQSIRLLELARA
jgi:hypothetical protein